MDNATAWGPYLVVAVLAFLWTLTEIVQAFRSNVRRALWSWWSGLLIGANVAFALLAFALMYSVFRSDHPYVLALATGVGWQALLRTRINLLQPLTSEAGEAVSISLADLYGRFQQFCREQIDQSLALSHIPLLEQATRLPVEKLRQQVRLFAHASALHTPEQVEDYLERLNTYAEGEQKLYLASYLLRQGGYGFLKERLKALEK
ncbi:MAG: hypothetical protein N2508_07745 [Anaerolineae bacterium]|nr:hypothetical protein [Anaerolineae bacterium]